MPNEFRMVEYGLGMTVNKKKTLLRPKRIEIGEIHDRLCPTWLRHIKEEFLLQKFSYENYQPY